MLACPEPDVVKRGPESLSYLALRIFGSQDSSVQAVPGRLKAQGLTRVDMLLNVAGILHDPGARRHKKGAVPAHAAPLGVASWQLLLAKSLTWLITRQRAP